MMRRNRYKPAPSRDMTTSNPAHWKQARGVNDSYEVRRARQMAELGFSEEEMRECEEEANAE
jgi:hypothetical protein